MSRPHLLSPFLATLLLSAVAASAQQVPPTTKRVPPAGVPIPDSDRQELEAGVKTLAQAIDALAKDPAVKPATRVLLPDVEIFHKAVDWPLRYNEFFDAKQVGVAKTLLKEGLDRAQALRSGQAPWTTATGLVVRGYRSRIDGSAQPYGLVVPTTWKAGDRKPRHLYIWNHGRGDTISELSFINEQMKKPGEFTPEDTFVLKCYGRFCNATKFAGETDVFEGMQHVSANYPIDPLRRVMVGFSMGGASVWHLGTHHDWMWAASSPGAGFAETAIYTKAFDAGKEPPPWWEQQLWHLYNATDYVANLTNNPLVAYSGEIDAQKASADLMEAAAQREGFKLERLIGPKVGHKYEPETKKELARRLEEYAAKGRPENPPKVRLVTYTTTYNRQSWVIVDGLEKHWQRADVSAEVVDPGTVRVRTSNVAALSFEMQGVLPLEKGRTPKVILDGQEVAAPAVTTGWSAHFRKLGGHWSAVHGPESGAELRKQHGLQGPIDDAFTDSFVIVRPTRKPMNDTIGKWVKSELDRAIPQWRTVFRGDARVVDDTAVTPEMIANSNLVLWGDPSSNAVLAKVLPQLPVKWSAAAVSIGKASYPAASFVPILIYPNPLNPKHYVVLNSSFTFRQGSDTTNALQTPKLPDWALVDLRTPPNEKWPGLVTDAGFFGEKWEVQN